MNVNLAIFIMLVVVHEWNVQSVAHLKILLTVNPTLNQNDSVNKSKCEIKMLLFKQKYNFSLPKQVFEVFYHNSCFAGLKLSQVQCYTRWATEQVY